MAKFKIKDSLLSVLGKGLSIYFTNLVKFTQYMLFPVLGQLIGIALIFMLTGWFTHSLPYLTENYSFLNNFTTITLILLLLALPGFAIFLKAFWDYLVAYGALNSMTDAAITTGKLYDFKAHVQVVTSRTGSYIFLLLIISILSLIAINPLFWVLGLIFFIYFILVFQIFTFESETTVTGCFRRSFNLIKGNFARTFSIMIILGLISHIMLNRVVMLFFELIKVGEFFKGIFETWALTLPLTDINNFLSYLRMQPITQLMIANEIWNSTVLFLVTGLTLPMRSICWTLWYKNLSAKENKGK